MNNFYRTVLFLIVILSFSFARSYRVDQIPNGNVFGCANCHVSPAGGGSRTDFGNEVYANYLSGTGEVLWGNALANIDSDGDGFTNGAELQDHNGGWSIGSAAPGNIALVTNPGDASSLDIASDAHLSIFKLEQNYPNPFNPATVINYQLPIASEVKLSIYSINGKLIKELVNAYQTAGTKSVHWDGKNNLGQKISGGVYIYQVIAGNYHDSRKMILMK